MSEQLDVGATWLPATSGPHGWADFRPVATAADLGAMRAAGITTARIHLAWDAFVPTHRQVNRHRLRDLDSLLVSARALDMRCVLVLFAQSFADGILLPAYAVDRRRRRQGVRVITDGTVVDGGPRDQWADPLMLEVETMWLETMLGTFAGHPAVACWDLGHDPAATIRPRRIVQMREWAALLGAIVRDHGERSRLTLGADDVLTARGVRLGVVSPHVDELGLVLDPQRLPLGGPAGLLDLPGAAFTLELAHRLTAVDGRIPPLHVVTGLAAADPADLDEPDRLDPSAPPAPPIAWDVPLLDPVKARGKSGELLGRLVDGGAAGVWATAWTALSDRVATAPPVDHRPSLARHGLARPDGTLRPSGEPWSALALAEREASNPVAWPASLDVEQYYAALPDSARDLLSAWREERRGEGGAEA